MLPLVSRVFLFLLYPKIVNQPNPHIYDVITFLSITLLYLGASILGRVTAVEAVGGGRGRGKGAASALVMHAPMVIATVAVPAAAAVVVKAVMVGVLGMRQGTANGRTGRLGTGRSWMKDVLWRSSERPYTLGMRSMSGFPIR